MPSLAEHLEGLGGAPARRGVVHVVAWDGRAPLELTARAAVLLASASLLVAEDPPDVLRRLAGGAPVRTPGDGTELVTAARDGEAVVRVTRDVTARAVVAELAAVVARGIAYEVEPVPSGGPELLRSWRAELPLAGVSVLVPRTRVQASRLSMHVRSLGGEPVEAPVLAVEPGDVGALDDAVGGLDGFTMLCLTSPNGVDALAASLGRTGRDARALAAVDRVACVGPGTAERLVARLAVDADVVPATSTTAALVEALPAGSGRVLLPRADIATSTLADGLRDKGWEPVEVAAYRTVAPPGLPPEVADRLAAGGIDLVAAASSSTVDNLVRLLDGRPLGAALVSIGPVTSRTARGHGIAPVAEADPHDLDGLVAALCRAAR